MRFRPPKLYAISDIQLSGLSHPKQVEALCEGGASLIQLRDKHLSPSDFCDQAEEALKIARRFQTKLLINDRLDIAAVIGADGVHIGQDDLPPSAVRKLLGRQAIVGLSTHDLAQVREALHEPVDYLAIGPIYQSATKRDLSPVVGLDQLVEIRQVAGDMPLVAIGGLNLENAKAVLNAGADSLAMISWLLQDASSISSRTRKLIDSL